MPLDRYQEKWERRTAGKGNKWKRNVEGQRSAYRDAVAEAADMDPSEIGVDDDWEEGVDAVSASEFNQAVEGKGQKWADNYQSGLRG